MLLKQAKKKYYAENKEKIRKQQKKYHKSKKGKEALERARQKERDNLSDNYIRQSIYCNIYNTTKKKIVRKDIPQEMIEQYRQIQIVKRKLKDENKRTNQKN